MKEFITERDLFDFVFFPTQLSEEKFSYLENSTEFSEEIKFFTDLKNSLQSELSPDQKLKIAEKIPAYNPVVVVKLKPVEQIRKRKVNGLKLAAASEKESKPLITSRTFFDDNRTYIIKILNYERSCKIFVFSTQYEVLKNIDLIISPQNLRYHIEDSTIPLELDYNVDPESVTLEFNLLKQS